MNIFLNVYKNHSLYFIPVSKGKCISSIKYRDIYNKINYDSILLILYTINKYIRF